MTSSKRGNENQNFSDKHITGKTLGKRKAVIGVIKTIEPIIGTKIRQSDMYYKSTIKARY